MTALPQKLAGKVAKASPRSNALPNSIISVFPIYEIQIYRLGRLLDRAAMAKSIHRPEYDALRQQLRQCRVHAGLTQTALSEAMGRPQSFISDIERGVRRLDVIELRELCLLFGTDLQTFINELEAHIPAAGQSPPGTAKKPR